MLPWGKLTWASAPPATVRVWVAEPGRLTVTLAAAPPGLRMWMLSLNMPAEALSYQLRWPVVAAWAALSAQTSLKDWLNWTLCEASTGWVEVTVTGTPMVPCGNVAEASAPGTTVSICEL